MLYIFTSQRKKLIVMENTTYYDKNLMDIRVNDLLKVYHFKSGGKTYYMYHVVVYNSKYNTLECKAYANDGNKGHYRLMSICGTDKIYHDAEIVNSDFHNDWQERERLARKRRKQRRLATTK